MPKRLIDEVLCGGSSSERPTVTDEEALRNLGRAERLTARRSTLARSANQELE